MAPGKAASGLKLMSTWYALIGLLAGFIKGLYWLYSIFRKPKPSAISWSTPGKNPQAEGKESEPRFRCNPSASQIFKLTSPPACCCCLHHPQSQRRPRSFRILLDGEGFTLYGGSCPTASIVAAVVSVGPREGLNGAVFVPSSEPSP